MVNSSEFAKRLEKLFEYYDLNASSFAEQIDVGRASISHLLSGRNKPSLDFVMKVVQTFPEVELYWLLNGKGEFPKKNIEKNSERLLSSPTPPSSLQTNNENVEKLTNQLKVAENITSVSSKSIKQIVLLYEDGTFETFNPA